MIKPVWLMQPLFFYSIKFGDYIVEPKIDGWRMQIIKNKNIEFWGRRLEKNPDWTIKLSYLQFISKFIPDYSLFDCELFSTKGRNGIPSLFSTHFSKPIIYIFDVIYFDNEFVGNKPLIKRKEILSNLKLPEPFYIVNYEPLKNLKSQFLKYKKENEGIVIKDINSIYEIGKDSPIMTNKWQKLKNV